MNKLTPESKVLPDFFKGVEIVGPATVEVEKYRALHKKMHENLALGGASTSVEVSAYSSPVLLASRSVREAYQSNNFAKIKQMEKDAQNDLQAIYTNVSTNGIKAWTKVRKDGKEFYLSWSNTGSMWAYVEKMVPVVKNDGSNEITYQAVVQIGSYSPTSKIAGIQKYTLTTPVMIIESAIALLVASAVSDIIAEGLAFVVGRFAMFLADAAANLGLNNFAFFVPRVWLANVASLLVFAVVFIGLMYLWSWLNRKYTIRLQVFNWDSNSNWSVAGQYMLNAKISGGDSTLEFNIPKMLKPGDVVTPPGFDGPVETLDSVCYYAVVIWENDDTFMNGCSMAVRMKRDGAEQGFMWAFDCPRFADNKQAGSDGVSDPLSYLDNVSWSSSPRDFSIISTPSKIPVHFALDALGGASDDLYNIIININKS